MGSANLHPNSPQQIFGHVALPEDRNQSEPLSAFLRGTTATQPKLFCKGGSANPFL